MRLLKIFLSTSPRSFILAIALGIISGVAGAALISRINAAMAGDVGTSAVLLFVGLAALRVLGGYASHTLITMLTQSTLFKLRMKIARQILGTPLKKIEEIGPSNLMALLTEDVVTLNQGGFGLAIVVSYITLVAACLVYLATLSFLTAVVVVAALVIGGLGQQFLNGRAFGLIMVNRQRLNAMFKGFRGITEGSKELMLHPARREAFLKAEIELPALEYRRRGVMIGATFQGSTEFQWTVYTAVIAILLFAMPARSNAGPLAGGALITLLYIQSAMAAISDALSVVARAEGALETLESLGLSLEGTKPLDPLAAAPPAWKALELKGISRTYKHEDDGDFVLGPLNLSLKAGEIVFLVGGNGSGKSTLAKVLCGLYQPDTGELVVDGQPVVTPESQEAHRQRFSAVFSDWYLFDRLYGIEDGGDSAQRYLKELRLDKKVTLAADGSFSTTSLSSGQRKRLMLLTAYLEDRPIYVFDEWAADQDPVFKKVFYTEILPRLKERGKAVFVISHDDSYFYIGDRIVRLDNGQIISDGPMTAETGRSFPPPAAAGS
jgi:putative ATP-binding cassette transporter